ncbi:MAG: hypothetical protein JW991_05495, partial [Candidatus Pacebacteria bacterium]|nr:hypothetical protein [Candidatus Paceibacterota bacterium]
LPVVPPTATPTLPVVPPTATPTLPPTDRRAILSLVPATGEAVLGGVLNLRARLESATQEEYSLVGVGIRLNFQKEFLEFESVGWDSGQFDLPIDVPDTSEEIAQVNADGFIEISLGSLLPTDQLAKTPTDLFTLTFKGKAVGSAEVNYSALATQEVIGYFPSELDQAIAVIRANGGVYQVTTDSQQANLNFQARLQGINSHRPDQTFRLSFRSSQFGTIDQEVAVGANTSGVFSGTAVGLWPGFWEVLVKGPVHLQKLFEIGLVSGVNNLDWTGTPFLTGDAQAGGNSFNRVDIYDLALLSQHFGSRMPVTGSRADLDLDGDVDIYDLVFISENFGQEGDS